MPAMERDGDHPRIDNVRQRASGPPVACTHRRVNGDWSDEETDNPLLADERNFYKLEKWTKDGSKVDRLIYAGTSLNKARKLFDAAVQHRPRIRLTIRQRTRVLEQWPEE